MVTKSQRYANHVISKKQNKQKKWRVVVLRISRHFRGCFEKHSMGKHKENLRTVYNLFDHWNMALSSDFRHLQTLLATRSVFHLFWRWQAVARALFQQPRNAAVLMCSRPKTSDTAIWASLQGFWYFAQSRTREIQVFPRNPAKFAKKCEIPPNPPEIFPNTCRQNIFNTYPGY